MLRTKGRKRLLDQIKEKMSEKRMELNESGGFYVAHPDNQEEKEETFDLCFSVM